MTRHPLFGLALATVATLVLTPDALLMRLSGMDGLQMVGWRGLAMGGVLLIGWAATSGDRGRDLAAMASLWGLVIVGCQFFNNILFSTGIAAAPVPVVLFGVATVPVFSALLARLLIGEPTRPSTWVTICAVLTGIGIAVFGGEAELRLDRGALFGALAGLGVALSLALNFVVLRAQGGLPIPLTVGVGSLLAGLTGLAVTGPAAMTDGTVWAILVAGAVILPFSFFGLSLAARYTHASNVSLLMLLETVLGPLWVWLGVGEEPTPAMLLGGAIVVGSLAVYLWTAGRRARRRGRAAAR
ncbi:DMT family transporter [Psychromarinibacter sp. C21-152]|uniref:DMT family transporter n=1 Tax=Psychromarinibacter sediminicola TaxID=3033385 RepID=A0AAE3TBI7_9RHOB|nr:DMT family transporter [Psychromarinibacter sediminicola]MDF0602740.1 DMT family transporter [Psychromarinibacter sediminicola]